VAEIGKGFKKAHGKPSRALRIQTRPRLLVWRPIRDRYSMQYAIGAANSRANSLITSLAWSSNWR